MLLVLIRSATVRCQQHVFLWINNKNINTSLEKKAPYQELYQKNCLTKEILISSQGCGFMEEGKKNLLDIGHPN